MNSDNQNSGRLGEQIGQLRVASETVEIGICVAAGVLGLALWQTNLVSPIVMIVGLLCTLGVLYFLYKSISGSWEIHELGFVAKPFMSSPETIAYSDVRSLTAKKTHHNHAEVYVGSQAEITLRAARNGEMTLKTDFRHGSDKERTANALIDRCSEAIELRLLSDMQEQGEVHWTKNVYLTSDGLKITESDSVTREIAFASISELKIVDNELKIWKQDGALPVMVMSNDDTNFIPKFRLFCALTAKTHELRDKAAAVAAKV